ncbi:MAG: DUF1015 domain-containing protein [bacterium]|nr:DUF1015 domain-containing protein [bacterium]
MSLIKPFKGYVPNPEVANQVASLPYDVLSSNEAREIAKTNNLSFLHVVKPEIDFPENQGTEKEEIYKKGSQNLQKLISNKILIQNDSPCYYIYQQQMGNHIQTGLVAGASVEEYDNNLVKKHEFTRHDKELDRTKHIETINANTGPVFLTYPQSEKIDAKINQLTSSEHYINFTADDNIKHTLWIIDNEKDIKDITDLFSNVPALYVADGHHRSAAASRVQKIKKEKNPGHTGNEQYNFFLSVIFPDKQMHIMDYNRCVKDINNHSVEGIISLIKENFEVEKLKTTNPDDARPEARSEFSMFLDNSWYKLKLKTRIIHDDPVNSLDVAILQNLVLSPILGINDPRTDKRIDFIGGIRGLRELEKRCKTDSKIAFALFPTGIDQLIAIADQNKVMPPKSTWFEPKLRSGMVVKTLTD